ncbi:hypothetical protein Droror1_Dr00013062 [Drosera rotundifolia]
MHLFKSLQSIILVIFQQKVTERLIAPTRLLWHVKKNKNNTKRRTSYAHHLMTKDIGTNKIKSEKIPIEDEYNYKHHQHEHAVEGTILQSILTIFFRGTNKSQVKQPMPDNNCKFKQCLQPKP